jgi:O-methyltransferase
MSALDRLTGQARAQLRRRGFDVVRTSGAAAPAPIASVFDDEVLATIEAVRPYTLTGPERVAALVEAVRYVVRSEVPGALVECGVWRGGSALAVLRTLVSLGVTDRDVWLYDTFTAMPAPTDRDVDMYGVTASSMHAAYAEDPSVLDPAYDYLPLEQVAALLHGTGYPADRIHLVAGLVEETIPGQAPDAIALLRLDTDYYTSTRHELEHLAPRVGPGGVLVVDDYGHWRGSQEAVDEWMLTLPRPLLLQRIDYTARLLVIPGTW